MNDTDSRPIDFHALADLLRAREVMDIEEAATYLGLKRASLEAACQRQRIGFVQYGAKKWFTRVDCDAYREAAARGRNTRLTRVEPEFVERECDIWHPNEKAS